MRNLSQDGMDVRFEKWQFFCFLRQWKASKAAEFSQGPDLMRDESKENFDRWFKDSKVVDEKGEPLVVYHSTFSDFSVFEKTKDLGFHFGSSFIANERVQESAKGRGRGENRLSGLMIKPVYLAIENPLHLPEDPHSWNLGYVVGLIDAFSENTKKRLLDINDEAVKAAQEEGRRLREAGIDVVHKKYLGGIVRVELKDKRWFQLLAEAQRPVFEIVKQAIKDAGYDGLTYFNEVEGEGRNKKERKKNPSNLTWVAFDSVQIKSALGNNGSYSSTNPDITDRVEAAKKAMAYLSTVGDTKEKTRQLSLV